MKVMKALIDMLLMRIRHRRPKAAHNTGRLPVLAEACERCKRTESKSGRLSDALATCTTCGHTYCTSPCFAEPHPRVAA